MLTYDEYINYFRCADTRSNYIDWMLLIGKTVEEAIKEANERY